MRVAIGSAFRNMAGEPLHRYAIQLDLFHRLMQEQGHVLRWIVVEGDSTDATLQQLHQYSERLLMSAQFVDRTHGGPVYGSTEAPERMKALSFVGNGIFEAVSPEDDALVYVESDLVWRPQTMLRLLHRLDVGTDVLAPLIFAGECFYDVWGFRKNGARFGPFPPYHSELDHGGMTVIDSAGSCLVMRADVARQCRMIDDMALIGFCKDAWSKGFRILCDARESIRHP